MVHPDKVEWVEELSESIDEKPNLVFTDYKGLTVHEMESLRQELYDNDSHLKVVKNRLAKLAFEEVWSDTNGQEPDNQTSDEETKEERPEIGDLPGVGPSKVDSLADHDFTSVESIADADIDDLTDVSGIGKKTAENLKESASEMIPDTGDQSTGSDSDDSSSSSVENGRHEAIDEWLNGTTAIAFNGSGYSRTAEILVEFAEEYEELSIKGGILNGEVLEAGQVKDVSELPSRRELLTSLASALQKPIQKLAFALNDPLRKLASSLKEVHDQKED